MFCPKYKFVGELGIREVDGFRINVAIQAIYNAAADPLRWCEALQAIADVWEDVGSIISYQREDGGFIAIGSSRLHALMAEYARDWSGRDLRLIRGMERRLHITKDVATDADLVDRKSVV